MQTLSAKATLWAEPCPLPLQCHHHRAVQCHHHQAVPYLVCASCVEPFNVSTDQLWPLSYFKWSSRLFKSTVEWQLSWYPEPVPQNCAVG